MDILIKNLKFNPLPYDYDALEPYIDAQTMELHHSKHHNAYYTKLLGALEGTDAMEKSFRDVLKNISQYPVGVRNNGGGHFNHDLFWNILGADGGGVPEGKLAAAIDSAFGSFSDFAEKFSNAAATRFGSGWAWLIVNEKGELEVCSTPNQDNPLMDVSDVKGEPILGLDVWEHAYYLKYQNRRPEYIDAFWSVVDWRKVSENFEKLKF